MVTYENAIAKYNQEKIQFRDDMSLLKDMKVVNCCNLIKKNKHKFTKKREMIKSNFICKIR